MSSHKDSSRDVVREHVHDGIQEYDNPLPSWWVWMFIGTIIFSCIYMAQFHFFGAPSLRQEMDAAMKSQASSTGGGDGQSAAVLSDEGAAARGKEVYDVNCAPCHGVQGEGAIGPNLTDKFWIHGGSEANVAQVVSDGVPDKGMPAWKPVLGPTKVHEVASFIWVQLRNKNVTGKEPQGSAVE